MDDSTFRILISTDNHLGYMERDAVRCNGDLPFPNIQIPIAFLFHFIPILFSIV